ncbi:PAS domain S-box protein [Prosthecochloris sp. HL-130-GSB]|uniref:PAS domain S-box protein n=1 Tax=Prosthecochloris sp. HL-130-GSB TaxID=1974213 RepID=UPI000A1C080E|nr:PAS domain S-box protein [Prosthecochloris sp. HL-130-GSB]ARM30858.1 hypothetical protein B9H02_05490 [Prosthecochloris sp. HL-130-GSB]
MMFPHNSNKFMFRVVLKSQITFIPIMTVILLMTLQLYSNDRSLHLSEIKGAAMKTMVDKQQCLSRQISSVISDIRFLATLPGIRDLLETPSRTRVEHLEEVLTSFSNAKAVYDQVRYIDAEGMEVLRINYNPDSKAVPVNRQKLQDKKDRYYFSQTVSMGVSGIYVSPFDLNIENGALEQPLKPMLRFAQPVTDADGKNILGIAILNFLGKPLIDRFSDPGTATHHRLILLNREGYYLAGAPGNMNWGFMFPGTEREVTFGNHFQEEWKTIRQQEEGQFFSRNGLFTFRKLSPLDTTDTTIPDDYHWLMVSMIPAGELQDMMPSVNSYILFVMFMGILVLGGSMLVSLRTEHHALARRELQAFYDHSPNLITLFSDDGRCIMANKAAAAFLGRSPLDLKGVHYSDFIPQGFIKIFGARLDRVLKTSAPVFEEDHIEQNGRTWYLQSIGFPITTEKSTPSMVGITSIDITRQKTALLQLHENERKLHALFSNLPGMAYRCLNTPDWPMEFVSSGCLRLTGYHPDELSNGEHAVSYNELIVQEDQNMVWDTVQQALENDGKFNIRYRIRTKTGNLLHVHEQGSAVHDSSGNLVALEGFIMDITDQVLYQEALQESEARFRTLFEGAPDAIFLANAKTGILIDANNKASQLTGKRRGEIIGRHYSTLHPPEEEETARNNFLQQQAKDRNSDTSLPNTESTLLHTNGNRIPVEIISQAMYLDNQQIMYAIFRDISRRKQAETELQAKTRLLETVTGTVPVYIYMKDRNLNYTFANSYALNHFQLSLDNLSGRNDRDFFPPAVSAIYNKDDRSVIDTCRPIINKEEELYLPDGMIIPVLTNKVPLIDSRGDVQGIVCVSIDRSEQKRAEKKNRELQNQLQNSQKLETLGTLAGGFAHDFNNILTPIIGFTELAIGSLPKDSPTISDLQTVLSAAKRAKRLVTQILTFSRKKPPSLTIQPLQPIIEESVAFLKPSVPSNITLQTTVEPFTQQVECDESQIQQVIMNLCTNAWQAMELRGGTLGLHLKKIRFDKQRHSMMNTLVPGKPYACITISDTGTGMSAGELERIFDPFYTTKEVGKGTGLGLPVVYGIIEAHHGGIDIESSKNNGTTVTVFLPLVDNET